MSGQQSRRRTVIHRMVIGLLAVVGGPFAGTRRSGTAGDRRQRRDHGGVGGQRRRRRVTRAQGTATSIPPGRGSGRTSPAARSSSPRETGAHIMTGRDPGEVRVAGRTGRQRPGFSHHRRGRRARPGQPQHHVQRHRQAGDLLYTRHRCARGAWADQRRLGQARRVCGRRSACPPRTRPTAATSSRRSSPVASCRTTPKTKTFTTVPPDLAGQLAGLEIPRRPGRRRSTRRGAPPGERWDPLGAAQGPPYQIGKRRSRTELRGRQDLLQPLRPGANVVTGQVLAKYESVGGPEGDLGFPTSSEVDGGLATASRMTSFAAEDKPVIFCMLDKIARRLCAVR